MKHTAILLVFILLTRLTLFAQHGDEQKQPRFFEDSLKFLSNKLNNDENELERKNANYAFIRTLVNALKLNNSYSYRFDSVKNISIINAPDNRFRMLTWHLMNDDGSYRYYGAIQMNTGGPLKLIPLEDYSPLLKNPEDSVLDNRKWYGAQYYKIIQVTAATPYYVLIGWKGNTVKSNKKILDVLSFQNGKPVFGMPVFEGDGKTRRRVVFEYNREASMILRYSPEQHLIVFDHLAPPQPKLKGQFETYGPDMTYSGYRLKEGRWIYADNLDMRNMPQAQDEQPYVDPKQQARIDQATASKKKAP